MNRFGKILLSGMFVCFIFIVGAFHMISADRDSSSSENRTLAQKPEMTSETITDGSYMQGFEDYYTDQFPARDRWLGIYVDYQLLINRSTINDYHVLEDDWIMPRPNERMNTKKMDDSATNLNDFGAFLEDEEIEFYYFSLPHKSTILQFLYPKMVEEGKERERLEYFFSHVNEDVVTAVNMIDIFEGKFSQEELKELYFRTDHHWNINGAFEAYKVIAETLNSNSSYFIGTESDLNEDSYMRACISPSDTFMGSYNRQMYMRVNSDSDNEKMCTMIREELFADYQVFVDEEEVEPFDLYGTGLNDENKSHYTYSNIFTTDKAEIKVVNESRTDAGNVLVIKNSYANPMTYHYAQNFYQTTFYDPRHNDERTIKEYIQENNFDTVIMMYNNTILTGKNYEWDK